MLALRIANPICLVVGVLVSYLSQVFAQYTNKQMSDKYHLLVTPASWAFTIWAVIYTFMAAYSIFSALDKRVPANKNTTILYST